jgi:ribonuclease BN (tRNA processing enzyme)
LVLDLGPGTLQELRKHTNYRTVAAIVISHMHVDHMADLLALRYALAYNPVRPPGRIQLCLPPDGKALLEKLAAVFVDPIDAGEFFSTVFAVSEYDPGTPLQIGDLQLAFTPTVHYIPCWAIRVASPEPSSGDLSYTADSGPAADLAAFAAGSRVLVAEATYLDPPDSPGEERGHLTAAEAGAVATRAGVSTLVLSHLWEELGFERYRAEAAGQFAGRLELARPGLHVEW